ncbi:MAG: cadherin domain-containing protein, partial [Pontiellaceae bacterium]|nr:cadherin domain-containing protein [Pontiellaceae bacterium]
MKNRVLVFALVAIAILGFGIFLKKAPSKVAGNSVLPLSGDSTTESRPASDPDPVSAVPEKDIAEPVARQEHRVHESGKSGAEAAPRITTAHARIEELFSLQPNVRASFGLPDGREAVGFVENILESDGSTVFVQGRITEPQEGFFFFRKQSEPGVAGAMTGLVRFDEGEIAYRVEPLGASGGPVLVERSLDEVICRKYDEQAAERASPLDPAEGDVADIVPQLESLPGAKAVAYLDFDGEEGPHGGWGDFYAEPWVGTAEEMTECWRQVAENFAPFHINITTKLDVYLAAPEASRIRCIMTPTVDAAPGAGGVAYTGSFNWTGDTPCWAFNGGPVGSAMTAAHEIGHTFGLAHDGTISGGGGYYGGHGSPFEVSWGPIMGAPFSANLIQWSKGEYFDADQTQDDLAIIVDNNNRMDYRADDHGGTLATATALKVDAAGAFNMPGIIDRNTDFDSFVFSTSGGTLDVLASTYSDRPNLDILLELFTESGVPVASSNPDTQVTASINQSLSAGTYELRISGVGRGDPLGDGYTDYGCMGHYTLGGTVGNAGYLMSVPRAAINGYVVGTLARGGSGSYAITGGTDAAVFAVDSASGVVTVSDASLLSKYNYSFLASTPYGPVAVSVKSAPSDIVVDVWDGIGGNNVSDLTGSGAYTGSPTENRTVSELDLQGFYDNYGERVRAYLVVPTSGTYHFWIASDDASQLRLSTDDQPANAQLIAYENGVSGQYNWTAHASQASAAVSLAAGQRYYLEMLHKEGGGDDYVAVAWQGPGIAQEIVPATALVPFGNRTPLLVNLDVSIQEMAPPGNILATMEVVDPDAGDDHTFSILSGNGGGLFQIDPSSGAVTLRGALEESDTPTHVLTVRAVDSAGNTADGTLTIHVIEPGAKLEIYDGIGGVDVDNLVGNPNYPNNPSRTEYLPKLEFQSRGDYYGSRMQAFLRVPETG